MLFFGCTVDFKTHISQQLRKNLDKLDIFFLFGCFEIFPSYKVGIGAGAIVASGAFLPALGPLPTAPEVMFHAGHRFEFTRFKAEVPGIPVLSRRKLVILRP